MAKKKVVDVKDELIRTAGLCLLGGPVVIGSETYEGQHAIDKGFQLADFVRVLEFRYTENKKYPLNH